MARARHFTVPVVRSCILAGPPSNSYNHRSSPGSGVHEHRAAVGHRLHGQPWLHLRDFEAVRHLQHCHARAGRWHHPGRGGGGRGVFTAEVRKLPPWLCLQHGWDRAVVEVPTHPIVRTSPWRPDCARLKGHALDEQSHASYARTRRGCTSRKWPWLARPPARCTSVEKATNALCRISTRKRRGWTSMCTTEGGMTSSYRLFANVTGAPSVLYSWIIHPLMTLH